MVLLSCDRHLIVICQGFCLKFNFSDSKSNAYSLRQIDDEHDDGGTKDIEDNVLGDTFDEEYSKEVELEESLPESRRAPSVLDVDTEGEAHSSNEKNTDDENGNNVEEFKVQIFFAFDFDNPNFESNPFEEKNYYTENIFRLLFLPGI